MITSLFSIRYPIVSGGMIWASGAKLAAAVSNAGGLGLIGAGSMRPPVFSEHLAKIKTLTDKPFGVNIPLLYKYSSEIVSIALEGGVKIFFTSAGSPRMLTPMLKEHGCTVVHVTSSPELALKCQDAGCDAIVAEGFEAGGHNGRDEITTFTLIPQVVDAVKIPVIAAGGIGDGRGMYAALALGAQGVQIGTRFAATIESSLHPSFKDAIVKAGPGDTALMMRKLVPVRCLKNRFAQDIMAMEDRGADANELFAHLGEGRSRIGMFEGDMKEGELEIGQISGMVKSITTVQEVVDELVSGFAAVQARLQGVVL